MKLKKQILSLCLALALALSLIPATVFAEDVTYDSTVEVTSAKEFYDAFTSEGNTKIEIKNHIADLSSDYASATVPAGTTKYIYHTKESGYYYFSGYDCTYSLTDPDSAVIVDNTCLAFNNNINFDITAGTLTIKNGCSTAVNYGNIKVNGDDAILNLETSSRIYASQAYVIYLNGTINLSGFVYTKLYFNTSADPMVITDSLTVAPYGTTDSYVRIAKWVDADGEATTPTQAIVVAQGTEDYQLTKTDLSYFSLTTSQKVSDASGEWAFYVDTENNQIIYGPHEHTYGDPVFTWSVDEDTGEVSATASITCTGLDDTQDDLTVEVTSAGHDATCTENSCTVYTATTTYNDVEYTDTYTVYSTENDSTGHTYGDPTFMWTENEDGSYSATAVFTCTSEDDTQTVDAVVTSETTEATCTVNGATVYTATATFNDKTYTDTKTVVIPATDHTYGEPAFTWTENEDGSYSVTAAFACTSEDDTQTVDAVVTSETTEATCTVDGATVYTATATFNDKTYTDTKTVVIPATDHTYGEPAFTWTENEDGSYSATAVFICTSEDDTQTVDTVVTSETTEATCTVDGEIVYTATVIFNDKTYTATKTVAIVATGHATEIQNAKDATCMEDGYTGDTVCTVCGETIATGETIPATGHTESEAVVENEVSATCTEAGSYDSVVYCAVCGTELSRETTTIPATGHNYEGSVVKTEATCTEDGSYVITVACTECDDELYTYTYTVPATGHTWDEGEETVEATRYTQGEVVYTCTECGATKTGYTNKVNATFLFDDVMNDSQYYFIPVYWAYDLGITDGTSTTTFSPSQGCTRAQFVTFLYRLAQANGVDTSIGDTSCNFTDVSSSAYYYKAVLWAAENGITVGTNTAGTLFSPDVPITRAQAVTMLCRYETMVSGAPEVTTDNPFSDVSENSYYTSILWAYENGVTKGTTAPTVDSDGVVTAKGVFSPNATCTRAQMVTFLYNYAAIQD